jgi:hypothetical protein
MSETGRDSEETWHPGSDPLLLPRGNGGRPRRVRSVPFAWKRQHGWTDPTTGRFVRAISGQGRMERYVQSIVSRPHIWPPPRSVTVDASARIYSVVMSDGVILTAPIPPDLEVGWEGLARSVADLAHRELELTLTTGGSVALALGWSDGGDDPPPGSTVVYLDQNHWVTLAQHVHAPDRVRAAEREGAQALVELASSGGVILPLSSAHLRETAPSGKHRQDLALTMLELSRGWQMRHPLAVRRRELAAALSGAEPRCEQVFTLEPDVVFGESTPVPTPPDFPPVWQEMHRRVVSATANVAVMLEEDDPAADPGAAERERWLSAYREHARRVQEKKLSREEVRRIAHATLLSDVFKEAKQAALLANADDKALAAWLAERSTADFERAPQLRTLEDMLYHRLRNPDDHWQGNDLLDMHFLSCAAGYADLVVAERKFGDYLKRARRRYPEN